MNAVYRTTIFAAIFAMCFALVACGNKGDLYLEKIELSAEQKAVLEGNAANDVNDVKESIDTDEVKKTKKKKADSTQTTE